MNMNSNNKNKFDPKIRKEMESFKREFEKKILNSEAILLLLLKNNKVPFYITFLLFIVVNLFIYLTFQINTDYYDWGLHYVVVEEKIPLLEFVFFFLNFMFFIDMLNLSTVHSVKSVLTKVSTFYIRSSFVHTTLEFVRVLCYAICVYTLLSNFLYFQQLAWWPQLSSWMPYVSDVFHRDKIPFIVMFSLLILAFLLNIIAFRFFILRCQYKQVGHFLMGLSVSILIVTLCLCQKNLYILSQSYYPILPKYVYSAYILFYCSIIFSFYYNFAVITLHVKNCYKHDLVLSSTNAFYNASETVFYYPLSLYLFYYVLLYIEIYRLWGF